MRNSSENAKIYGDSKEDGTFSLKKLSPVREKTS